MFGLQFYHHATGQYSVIFATLIKFYAIFSNSAAMSTTSTSDPYLSGKNSYAYTTSNGVYYGIIFGFLMIMAVTFFGIITIPFTAPIILWKTID
jgi:hypothetical protein